MLAHLLNTLTSPSSHPSQPHELPLTTTEALSGILGSVSLACWIFLLLPQLLENYRNGSAEAVSLAFIFVWFLGDICNLVGALWAGLVPVIVAIAVYFCISDGVLISQCLYYGIRNKRRQARMMLARERGESVVGGQSQVVREGETAPLLGAGGGASLGKVRTGSYTGTIPGSGERRRSSGGSERRRSSAGAQQARNEHLAKILEETDESGVRLWGKNALSVLGIVVVGTAGWAAAYGSGAWKPSPPPDEVHAQEMAAGAQVLGYASAVLYLGARLPQIYKNWQEKSCEGMSVVSLVFLVLIQLGLSLLFFILSLLGNLTYGAGILAHSLERNYVMTNVPWLIGSLGTMVEDVVIFAQFHIYRKGQIPDDSAIE
jgi:solute carrier family 66 (lysosomal lysine-arginine transporter), member 1